jgi:hypothetical protein
MQKTSTASTSPPTLPGQCTGSHHQTHWPSLHDHRTITAHWPVCPMSSSRTHPSLLIPLLLAICALL